VVRRIRRVVPIAALVALALTPVAALPRSAGAQGGARRYADVLVLGGFELAPFAGATASELWAWSWDGTSWARLVLQVDEIDLSGSFVAREDGALDNDDEVVLPLAPTGVRAPDGAWPPGIDRTHPPIEVHVTDPLDPALDAYSYVFRSSLGPRIAAPALVSFDASTHEVRTPAYTLGLADPASDAFVGIKRLSLFGGSANLIDRLKLRFWVTVAGQGDWVTEDDLAYLAQLGVDVAGLAPDPVIVGPVRIVFDATGSVVAYPCSFDLAFAALEDMGSIVPGGQIGAVRASLDFGPAAASAVYRDANVPGGVPVDGQPDTVPASPLPAWREVAFPTGRWAIVSRPDAPSTATVYYEDDGSLDATDTGDRMAYADNGVAAPDVASFVGGAFPGTMVALPPGGGPSAAQLVDNLAAPLDIAVTVRSAPPTATPGQATATTTAPTPPSPSPTIHPSQSPPTTPAASDTPSPTTPPTTAPPDKPVHVFVPYVLRRH
jgi:hypothetical protein